MTGTSVMEKPTSTQWSLDHPRVRELWRTTNEAYCTIADAIEEAARMGVPVEIIATTACVPQREVELILKDAEADEEVRYA
jgi:hypothetical protein